MIALPLLSAALLLSGPGNVPGLHPHAGPSWAGPRPPELRLVAESLDGRTRSLGFSELPLEDPRKTDVWLVRPEGFPRDGRPLQGPVAEVRLAGGDLIRGRITGGEGDFLALQIRGGVVLALSVEELSSFRVPDRFPPRLDEPLAAPAEGDRLYRRTGSSLDRIDGTLEGFGAEGLVFESVLGSKSFPWDEVAALFVEVLDEAPQASDSPLAPVVLDLVDGSRLRGRLERIDVQGARMRLGASHSAVSIAWEDVEELAIDDGSLAFLSALPVQGELGQGTPFDDDFGMRWPHRADRSVLGEPLRAGGRTWARGIGMHAPSRVSWSIGPHWDELRGFVAVDDSSLFNAEGARGSVVFRVRLDGELLWESPVVRGGDGPRALPGLRLGPASGPRVLELEADPVEDFRGDRADWLRVLLVDTP